MLKKVYFTPYHYRQMVHPMSNGLSHLSDGLYPNSTKNSQLSSNDLDYNPENTEQDLGVYTEVKLKDDVVASHKADEKSESEEKDLRTRMFGFLLGCLASLILAISAACVQVCTFTKSYAVHDTYLIRVNLNFDA